MIYRPLRSLGRFVLAACAVGLGAASLGAQTPATPAPAWSSPSRFDVFTGYSYFGAHGQVQPFGLPYSSINLGAIGSGAYYFNKYFGGEFIYSNHPSGVNDGFQGASAGPIFRLPMENFTLFAHGLVGGTYLGGPNSEVPATVEHEPYTWGTGLTAGGGMDYDLPFFDHRFSLRLFEADYRYIHTDFGPTATIPTGGVLGGRTNLDAIELSTGIVTHFGHIVPPPPVTYACSASPTSGYPGDPITVTGTATNLNPKKASTTTYSWTATGGVISGTSSTATIDTKSASAGSYTATGNVTEGPKPGESAGCTAAYTVMAFQPPTVSCSANPSSVNPGDSSTITAQGMSPQNRPLTYSYNATAGSINGTSSSATLSTAGAAPGTITVSCNVVDDKGQSASATTSVTVIPPPPPPVVHQPEASSLGSLSFDPKKPARVDNQAKAVLDDDALALQRSPDAKIALVGNEDSKEAAADAKRKKPALTAAERAVNTKEYLVQDKGIDPSRITVYTGSGDSQTVDQFLVPAGATLNTAGDTPVDETTVKAVPRDAPVRKKK
jgi:hypothetical protein